MELEIITWQTLAKIELHTVPLRDFHIVIFISQDNSMSASDIRIFQNSEQKNISASGTTALAFRIT